MKQAWQEAKTGSAVELVAEATTESSMKELSHLDQPAQAGGIFAGLARYGHDLEALATGAKQFVRSLTEGHRTPMLGSTIAAAKSVPVLEAVRQSDGSYGVEVQ